MSDASLTDEQVRELWQWAAEAAHEHLPWVCGHEDGRCKYRRLNLEECDGLLDEWLLRHPITSTTSITAAPGAPTPTP